MVENTRSIRVLKKAGFTEVGILPAFDELDGEWRDFLLMERRISRSGGLALVGIP